MLEKHVMPAREILKVSILFSMTTTEFWIWHEKFLCLRL